MTSFFSYLLCIGLGAGIILFGIKRRPTLKQKREVTQLQTDKTNLQTRNGDLKKVIQQNQEEIKELKDDIRELKEAVATLSGQVILNLELLSSVTSIREQVDNIETEIIITKRWQKKYSRFLSD